MSKKKLQVATPTEPDPNQLELEDAIQAALAAEGVAQPEPQQPETAEPEAQDELQQNAPEAEPEAKTDDQAPDPEPELAPQPAKLRILYMSREPEPSRFSLYAGKQEIRGFWDYHRQHLYWRVPIDDVDAVDRHPFVTSGRIVKLGPDLG